MWPLGTGFILTNPANEVDGVVSSSKASIPLSLEYKASRVFRVWSEPHQNESVGQMDVEVERLDGC
jgi:hypothetical protein